MLLFANVIKMETTTYAKNEPVQKHDTRVFTAHFTYSCCLIFGLFAAYHGTPETRLDTEKIQKWDKRGKLRYFSAVNQIQQLKNQHDYIFLQTYQVLSRNGWAMLSILPISNSRSAEPNWSATCQSIVINVFCADNATITSRHIPCFVC